MTAALPDLVARIRLDTTELDQGVARAESGGKRIGPGMTAGLAVAGAAVAGFAKGSVAAFVESEQASVRLDEALKKFPATSDVTRASFDRLNESLAKKTRFDDDATASGQAVLAQFGLTGTEIQQLTPLLQDYAAKTGKDMPSAAEALGKAVLGQGRALKDVGIDFQDTGTAAGNLDQIMGGLKTQVGGFATAEGQTAAGQAEILKNRFGEMQEAVGARLVPALSALAGALLSTIDFLDRHSAVVVPLAAVLGGLAAVILGINVATSAWAAAQAALNVVLALNPIGLVVLAIAALVAGLVIAWKNSETFRDIVTGAWDAVKGAAQAVFDFLASFISGIFDGLKAAAQRLADFFTSTIPNAWETVKTKTSEAWDTVKATVSGAIDTAVEFVKALPGRFVSGLASLASDLAGVATTAWNAFDSAVDAVVSGVIEYVKALPGNFVSGLANLGSMLAGAATSAWSAFSGAVSAGIDIALGYVTALPGNFVRGLGNLSGLLVGAGGDLLRGLATGISGAIRGVVDKAVSAARAVVDGIKGALGISSPSKVMAAEVGKPMAQGVAAGLLGSMGLVDDALAGLTVMPRIGSATGPSRAATGGAVIGRASSADLRGLDVVVDRLERIESRLGRMPRDYQLGERSRAVTV